MKRIKPLGMKALCYQRCSHQKLIEKIRLILTAGITTALLLALPMAMAMADSVTLAWDANNPAPDEYRVYKRVSDQSQYDSAWSCQVKGTSCTIDNLTPGTTYHFVVRAVVGNDVSGDSNEVSHTTGTPPTVYRISASAESNGKIDPNGEVTVIEGGSLDFTITPDPGYHISDVLVDDQSVEAKSTHQFTNVTAHHSIKAVFERSNRNPIANAGSDQTVDVAENTVALDGSNSNDPDTGDTIAGYQWRQISGTPVQLSDANMPRCGFTTPNVGVGGEALEFELRVTDQSGASATDRCIVNVTRDNKPPQADAGGPLEANEGESVVLNGSGSTDPENDQITFNWNQILGPTVTLTETQTANPKFSTPDVGSAGATLTFQLTVTDSNGLKDTDTCAVNVAWVNSPPRAEPGESQTVTSGQLVNLDGSRSSDPDGNLETYQWVQTTGPTVTLSDPTGKRPSFVAPQVDANGATLAFELTVLDTEALSSSDTCLVNVQPNTDTDGDGHADSNDAFPEDPDEWSDSDADGVGNNTDDDDDGDGMPDSWETQYGLDPLNPGDADMDPDGDGLTNRVEAQGGTNPTIAETSGDWSPSVISPADGDTQISISRPYIEIDTNGIQEHTPIRKTLWQILSHDGQTVVFSVISDRHLSKIRVPFLVLTPKTAFQCRVRCYDSNNQISGWSPTKHFITEEIANDDDLDGVPDNQEVAIGSDVTPAENISANLNGDRTSRIIAVDISADSGTASLISVMRVDPEGIEEAPDDSMPAPFAMLASKILTEPGEQATLRIYFDKQQNPESLRWIQYDAVNGWQEDTQNAELEQNGKAMDVTVQDGGHGDADGVANGAIINLSGPASDAGASNNVPTSGGGGSQCFIRSLFR